MRANEECAVVLGRFYESLLEHAVWPSQSALSQEFQVSKSQVSKSIKAARLPESVQRAFGGEHRISFRTVDLIEQMGRLIGNEKLHEHALKIGPRPDLSVTEVLGALASGSVPEKPKDMRLSSRKGEDFIRLYTPHLRQMKRNLPRLQAYIDFAMQMMGI